MRMLRKRSRPPTERHQPATYHYHHGKQCTTHASNVHKLTRATRRVWMSGEPTKTTGWTSPKTRKTCIATRVGRRRQTRNVCPKKSAYLSPPGTSKHQARRGSSLPALALYRRGTPGLIEHSPPCTPLFFAENQMASRRDRVTGDEVGSSQQLQEKLKLRVKEDHPHARDCSKHELQPIIAFSV